MSPTAAMLILANHKPSSPLSRETSVSKDGPFSCFKHFLDYIHIFEERSSVEQSSVETRGKNPSSEAELCRGGFVQFLNSDGSRKTTEG